MTNDSQIDDIVQITKDIVGLHATSATTPYLSLFARSHNFQKDQLDEALYVKRELGKIRCVRKTLYILPKETIPIAYAVTQKLFGAFSQRYAEARGFSVEKYQEVSELILDLLKSRELTTIEIRKALKPALKLSPILYLMCDQGLLVRSRPKKGWKDRNHTYALFQKCFPTISLAEYDEMQALTQLVRQYLQGFGPVTENDIVWWVGLGKKKIREALGNIQEEIAYLEISDLKKEFIQLKKEIPLLETTKTSVKPAINLLPTLDPYLMGYKERERYLHSSHYEKIFDRSGNATSTILLNGRVIGVWDFTEDPDPLIKLLFFEDVEERLLSEIQRKASRIGQFICEKDVQLVECDSMVPLKHRTAGAFLTPLKDCKA